jgi:hypothetical protein
MKFIKKQDINPKSVTDNTLSVNSTKQVIMETTEAVLVPKGTEIERPSTPVEGFIRYNTTDGEFEGYQNGQWRELAFKQPKNIVQERFGPGDFVTADFGPLNSGDPDFVAPTNPNNILVFVGNVIQIAGIDYTLSGSGASTFVSFVAGAEPPLGEDVTVIHGLDK